MHARCRYVAALEIRRSVLGERNAETARSYYNLAVRPRGVEWRAQRDPTSNVSVVEKYVDECRFKEVAAGRFLFSN